MRDSDGGRRLLEMHDSAAMPSSDVSAMSTTSFSSGPEPPKHLERPRFVASQPASTANADTHYALYAHIDVSGARLPRKPWPADAKTPTQFRKKIGTGIMPASKR